MCTGGEAVGGRRPAENSEERQPCRRQNVHQLRTFSGSSAHDSNDSRAPTLFTDTKQMFVLGPRRPRFHPAL